MARRSVLIAGGTLYQMPQLKDDDFVVAIDSGLEHCRRYRFLPDVAIGDFDSASEATLAWAKANNIPQITYPSAKNETDTELAVGYALEQGAEEILILAGLGTRFDHSLANIQLLLAIAQQGARGEVTDGRQRIFLLQKQLTLKPERGMCFSLLPLSLELEGLTIRGARYPLHNKKIKLGNTRTISNEFAEGTVELSLEAGVALVFIYPDTM